MAPLQLAIAIEIYSLHELLQIQSFSPLGGEGARRADEGVTAHSAQGWVDSAKRFTGSETPHPQPLSPKKGEGAMG